MHFYQHNIKAFNNATRHLTRVERALYRDLIELYYDTEQPLPAVDFDRLARRVLATSDEEKTDLLFVLDEFFERTGDVWTHTRCDEEIEKYRDTQSSKARAGKASAESRKKKAEERKRERKGNSEHEPTGDEQVLDTRSTYEQLTSNHEPVINNQSKNPSSEPVGSTLKFSDDDLQCAEFIFAGVKRAIPKTKTPNLEKWANTVRLMREADSLDHKEICEVFAWANRDSFWSTNILSASKLRDQFPALSAKKESQNANSNQHSQHGFHPNQGARKLSTVDRNNLAAERYLAECEASEG